MNSIGTQNIETKRLILRKIAISDAEDMFNNWASDNEVTKYVTWRAHKSIEDTRKIINFWLIIPY
ncbi:MAG: GNAT family N-acetyltransferase [Xylanivirga thermophila]|jgi:[ribosomal protein S5]-alanine N-acetyltransferase|uniref:GNAT family N-acetyltransferase n=1 Tax=Xylanivirga thermophila TaxID=2496273 RepID=UPI00101C8C80|nr:GNAT family N-acetyltransferase [Xylanivirga thermophila]